MNEFAEMLKEAFVGEEPFDPRPGREAIQASIRKYDARMKTVRYMAIFAVTFMSVVCVYCFVWLLRAPDEMRVHARMIADRATAVGQLSKLIPTQVSAVILIDEIRADKHREWPIPIAQ